ncbi:uncharacterized protein LOC132700585 [Cylas formicarius]|uniref:uncharacterized protein LOC132700585 n=1 Tax=Cylas formicarius TaxID=197179 RepID=UPI0029585158|nr:uncharacterized protein LOC132700585 [Cylas formicarius]
MVGESTGYAVLVLLIFFFSIEIEGVKDIAVSIPMAARILDTVTLHCNYDLEGEPLYTVKWYKGQNEFYRFIPKELPNTQIFPLPGINVDLSESTPNEIVLRDVQPEVTGRYTCEVSSDAPLFDTKMNSGYMYVVDIPIEDPVLAVEKDLLDIGEVILANCTAPPSFPATNISWYLNGKRITNNYLKQTEVTNEILTSIRKRFVTTSVLKFEVGDSTFEEGKAVLSCVASLFNIYRGEKKEIIEEAKPKPRPSSVLGPRGESSDCSRIHVPIARVLIFTLFFWKYR